VSKLAGPPAGTGYLPAQVAGCIAGALGEHFAQGRLTLDELHARLGATLTATTYGELCQALRDLP